MAAIQGVEAQRASQAVMATLKWRRQSEVRPRYFFQGSAMWQGRPVFTT